MSARMLAASAFAVLCAIGAPAVSAADMYDDDYDPKAESPYNDPRYGDIYGTPRPPRAVAPPPQAYPPPPYPPYGPRYGEPQLRPFGEPPRFADRGPGYADSEPGCVPRHAIRRQLAEEGWGDLHDLEVRGRIALVRARRPDGRLYELKVDRCSGEIVRARPSDDYGDAFAFRQRHEDRRYSRY